MTINNTSPAELIKQAGYKITPAWIISFGIMAFIIIIGLILGINYNINIESMGKRTNSMFYEKSGGKTNNYVGLAKSKQTNEINRREIDRLEKLTDKFIKEMPSIGIKPRNVKIYGFKDGAQKQKYFESLKDLEHIYQLHATRKSPLYKINWMLQTHQWHYHNLYREFKSMGKQ